MQTFFRRYLPEFASRQLLSVLNIKRLWNFFKIEFSLLISRLLRRSIVWGQPYILTVEVSSRCNLKCPLCAVGTRQFKRSSAFFDLDLYRKLLDELGNNLVELILFNQGEPFLHPRLVDLIKIAGQKKIYTSISTNGHFLTDPEQTEQIVRSGLNVLIVSLDGASPDIYQQYRQGGDFQQVIAGIQQILRIRNLLNKHQPEVYLQFLVTRQNEHELDQIKQLARELKVDRLLLKTLQVDSANAGRQFLPGNTRYRRYHTETEQLTLKRSSDVWCRRLWRSSVLLSDGRVVGCCFDKNGDYPLGVFSENNTFNQIWQSAAYEQLRNRTLRKRSVSHLCANCTEGIELYS